MQISDLAFMINIDGEYGNERWRWIGVNWNLFHACEFQVRMIKRIECGVDKPRRCKWGQFLLPPPGPKTMAGGFRYVLDPCIPIWGFVRPLVRLSVRPLWIRENRNSRLFLVRRWRDIIPNQTIGARVLRGSFDLFQRVVCLIVSICSSTSLVMYHIHSL